MNVCDGRITADACVVVGAVVAAEVDRVALDGDQLVGDRLLVRRRASRPGGERSRPARGRRPAAPAPGPSTSRGRSASRGCRSSRPCGRAICSRSRNVPVARSRVSPRILACGLSCGRGVLGERLGQGEELAEAVPAQVVLLDQLLHVLGRRAAGAGLEQAAAVDQRDDREHLGAGAELEDREQVGEVVAQHVAGDRDGVLALADALEGVRRGELGREDLDLEARRCRGRAGRPGPWRSGWRRGRGSRRARRPPGRRSRAPASTASLTQSRTGTSLVWQARQMSPASTSCSISTSPGAVDHAHGARGRRSRRSCRASRTPRPPGPSARRWAPSPSWSGRRRRGRGSRR